MTNYIEKPNDWPQNGREWKLETICDKFEKFIKDPSLSNKELLLSLVTSNDLNEENPFGLCRFTEYEVALINEIYAYATMTQCTQAKLWLYEFIIDTVILKKTTEMMMLHKSFDEVFASGSYMGLHPALKVFYNSYIYFRVEKDKTFFQQLILTIKTFRKAAPSKEVFIEYIRGINMLIYDLSFNINSPKLAVCQFDRGEIKQLFETVINILNEFSIDPSERPYRGVFLISIANYVLKSRNNHSNRLIYKCLPNSAAQKTFINKQVWMKNTKLLNDKREGITFKNIMYSRNWMNQEWAKKVKLINDITKYVCSFSNERPNNKMMNKYGHNIYGFKNDRIANLLSPIYNDLDIPQFSLVMAYDVLYDHKSIKDEINYIIDIINCLNINDEKKNDLFASVLSYWDLTVKDKKWAYENERRYEIRIFNHNYVDATYDSSFFKIISSLYLLPDFISKENIKHDRILMERKAKLSALSVRDYQFCNDCLQADFDNHSDKVCRICGSDNVITIKIQK